MAFLHLDVCKPCCIFDSGQVCGFMEGDQLKMDQLLRCLLVYSGNDAAAAIARHVGGSVEEFTIYSFTRGFRITLGIDGPAMLFAGMVSFMWPFVTLYAYEYMERAEHKNSFFGFYIMTEQIEPEQKADIEANVKTDVLEAAGLK